MLATEATQTPRNSRASGGASAPTTARVRGGAGGALRPGVATGVGLAGAGAVDSAGFPADVGADMAGRHAPPASKTSNTALSPRALPCITYAP